jgi:hypothetical protein
MRLVRDDDLIYIAGYGLANIYRTLKPTRFSIYIPYYTILVEDHIIDAVIAFLRNGGFADMALEEYLDKLGY